MSLLVNSYSVVPGATLWTPAQLPALVMWLKGDSLVGANGDPITTWVDSSGLSHIGSSSGANRPALRTAALNSLNVVDFDAITTGSDYFTLPNFMTGYTAGTVYLVVKINNDPPAATGSAGPPIHTTTNATAEHYPFTDGNIYFGFGSSTRFSVGRGSTPIPAGALASWHIACFRSAVNDWKFYRNGTLEFTTATNTVAFSATPYVGAYNLGTGPFYNGRIAEMVMTNDAASLSDRQKVEGYLAYNGGLQSVLYSGHPYESSPPYI